jgi:hypothetical protein
VTNGYQLLEALNAKIKEQTKSDTPIVSIYNAVLNSGSIAIPAVTYDRMIYAFLGGTVTSFDARCEINGSQILRLNGGSFGSASWLLPANVPGEVEWVTGTATVVVNSVKLGQ